MLLFYKIWKNYNEIQLTKNKMDLNNRKMKNHLPSHAITALGAFRTSRSPYTTATKIMETQSRHTISNS